MDRALSSLYPKQGTLVRLSLKVSILYSSLSQIIYRVLYAQLSIFTLWKLFALHVYKNNDCNINLLDMQLPIADLQSLKILGPVSHFHKLATDLSCFLIKSNSKKFRSCWVGFQVIDSPLCLAATTRYVYFQYLFF